MQSGARIGSVFGIPLYINSSLLVVLVVFTLLKGGAWGEMYPQWGEGLAFFTGFLSSVLLFVSVLLHELGHSLVARSQGITVNSITLFLFGGLAAIDSESKTPGKAFQVAIAGPAVSFALFVLLSLGASYLPSTDAPASVLLRNLATINFVLCAFNLIPGLPLDGGQVLKAAIWKFTGDRFKAARWAAKAGTLVGGLGIAFGLSVAFTTSGGGGGLWLAFIGWFILQNANRYSRLNGLQQILAQTPITQAMSRRFRVVEAKQTLRDFAEQYLLGELDDQDDAPPQPYFAASDGRYRGAIYPEELRQYERSQWDSTTLADIAHPLDTLRSVPETATLREAILTLEDSPRRNLTVLTPAGAIAGVLDRADLLQAVLDELGVTISPSQLAAIRAEGRYPATVPLAQIAKATQQ